MDSSVDYLGFRIKSPIIVGGTMLCDDMDNLKRMEEYGAGAVILPAVFEEAFVYDQKMNTRIIARTRNYGATYDYLEEKIGNLRMDNYFEKIQRITEQISIPVIGCIDCFSFETWVTYLNKYEYAGCKGLEFNIALRPYDPTITDSDVLRFFNQTVPGVRRSTSLPFSFKIGPNYTNIAKLVQQISYSTLKGISLFGDEYPIDIDIDKIKRVTRRPEDRHESCDTVIQWISCLAQQIKCNMSASTGINTWQDVVKLLLAGATTTQVNNCLHRHGIEYIKDLNEGLQQWMQQHEYESTDQFIGSLAIDRRLKASTITRIEAMQSIFEPTYNN